MVVAPDEKRTKFVSLLDRVPYRRMKDRFRFVSYEELVTLFERAAEYHELRNRLLGE